MIPSAVPHVARKGRHGSTATVATAATAIGMIAMATGLNAKCFLRYALSVEKLPRYHSSPAKIGRFIVAIATVGSGLADKPQCVCPFNKYYKI